MRPIMESSETSNLMPQTIRLMLRNGELKRKPTTFCSIGYKQANLVILHKSYAYDFRRFCEGNSGALPLLYESKPGEWAAPPLCNDSDVRSDVPLYNKWVNGQLHGQLESLQDYNWSDFVTFYLGCSFSFNYFLLKNNILTKVDQSRNVSMFVSNIECFSSGPFKCNMVVSMRAIPKNKLSLLATITDSLSDVHGPPIHYGNPKMIGVADVGKPDFGETTKFNEDDIAVFWCCGVTGMESVKQAKLDLAFSHVPGMMFLTDIQVEDPTANSVSNLENASEVVKCNEKSSRFSTLSAKTLKVVEDLFHIASEDPMNRGLEYLKVSGDFAKAALSLSHSTSIALITGFPVHMDCDPPDETDGLPGIISLASVLQTLGKQVTLIVDDYALSMNKKIIEKCVERGILQHLKVMPFIASDRSSIVLKDGNGEPMFDVVFASERVGRSSDGNYYSMRGKNVSSLVNSIDDFFAEATEHPDVTTIAVGDGGNELGMGKVESNVRSKIPLGEQIACVEKADHLIAAGCSNWGCSALGFALLTLRSCPVHERYLRRAVGFPFKVHDQSANSIPNVAQEREILSIVESFGIKDGVAPTQKMSVDGMFFDKEHTDVLERMRRISMLNG